MMFNLRYFCFFLISIIFLSCEKNKSTTYPENEDIISLIKFRSFLKSDIFFMSNTTQLIVLRNKADEQVFLDTIRTIDGREFPEFSYGDSMLVGIIIGEKQDFPLPAASSDTFSIDSLKAFSDSIVVYSHLFIPKIRTEDIVWPCHFVTIKRIDNKFQMEEVLYTFENPY